MGQTKSMSEISAHPALDSHELRYDGRTGTLLRIVFVNLVLTTLTLTVYRFWARTRVRRFLWSGIRFLDDRIEYVGRARELFFGALIVVVVFVPLVFFYDTLLALVVAQQSLAFYTLQLVYLPLVLWLMAFAYYRARRYRLSRTLWRGVRAGQSGAALAYAFLWLAMSFATILTAGLLMPFRNAALYRYRLNHSWFGDKPFESNARGRDLIWVWVGCWLLILPTLGLFYLVYRGREIRYFAKRTRFGALTFRSTISVKDLIVIVLPYIPAALLGTGVFTLFVCFVPGFSVEAITLQASLLYGAFLIIFVTLFGIARLLVAHRFIARFCQRLTVTGAQDFGEIAARPQGRLRFGEGLADALDLCGV